MKDIPNCHTSISRCVTPIRQMAVERNEQYPVAFDSSNKTWTVSLLTSNIPINTWVYWKCLSTQNVSVDRRSRSPRCSFFLQAKLPRPAAGKASGGMERCGRCLRAAGWSARLRALRTSRLETPRLYARCTDREKLNARTKRTWKPVDLFATSGSRRFHVWNGVLGSKAARKEICPRLCWRACSQGFAYTDTRALRLRLMSWFWRTTARSSRMRWHAPLWPWRMAVLRCMMWCWDVRCGRMETLVSLTHHTRRSVGAGRRVTGRTRAVSPWLCFPIWIKCLVWMRTERCGKTLWPMLWEPAWMAVTNSIRCYSKLWHGLWRRKLLHPKNRLLLATILKFCFEENKSEYIVCALLIIFSTLKSATSTNEINVSE